MSTAAETTVAQVAAGTRTLRMGRVNVGRLIAHVALLFLVVIWVMPTFGLLISSLRDKDQLTVRRASPRQLPRGPVRRGHRPGLHQLLHRHDPGDHHPDPHRRLRRLRASPG
jgi:hypothetical protein